MGRLTRRLDAIRSSAPDRIPEDALSVMKNATERLRASGLTDGVPDVGDSAPLFARPTPEGEPVRLAELLDEGPVVLSFFRGRW